MNPDQDPEHLVIIGKLDPVNKFTIGHTNLLRLCSSNKINYKNKNKIMKAIRALLRECRRLLSIDG